MNKFLVLLLTVLYLIGCGAANEEQLTAWEKWKGARVQELMSPDGFMNLAGLYWLKPGSQTLGGADSTIKLPSDWPSVAGTIIHENGEVWFMNIHPEILIDSVYHEKYLLYSAETGLRGKITYKSYVGYLIERAGQFAIRLKNLDHPNLKSNPAIQYFDFNPDWQIYANYEPYLFPKTIRIENVFGQVFDQEIPGQIKFEMKGKQYTLEPIQDGDQWFIIFSDLTSAVKTYGSGRYLYATHSKNGQAILLDFNQSHNPPCAFTPFATCFLPPPENYLPLRVEAGELDFHFENDL